LTCFARMMRSFESWRGKDTFRNKQVYHQILSDSNESNY
jgi:hypothetical protein